MRVLLTNPEVDVLTRYLLAWTEDMLKKCKNTSNDYYHLMYEKVTRNNFESILTSRSVDLILLCGHGSSTSVSGDNEVVLDKNNSHLLNGKVAHALSCQSAKILGKDAVKKGAVAYVGYKEDFVAFLNNSKSISRPLEDKTAALFLDAAFTVPKILLRGASVEDAVVAAKNEYNHSIKKAINSDIQSDDDQFLNWLYWDRDNLVICN